MNSEYLHFCIICVSKGVEYIVIKGCVLPVILLSCKPFDICCERFKPGSQCSKASCIVELNLSWSVLCHLYYNFVFYQINKSNTTYLKFLFVTCLCRKCVIQHILTSKTSLRCQSYLYACLSVFWRPVLKGYILYILKVKFNKSRGTIKVQTINIFDDHIIYLSLINK